MPRVEVEGYGAFAVPAGVRLVRALEEHGVDILHRCGGIARCTSCRVTFTAGEPERISQAEYNKLDLLDLLGQVRLACQIVVEQDMRLRPLQTLKQSGLSNAGPTGWPIR